MTRAEQFIRKISVFEEETFRRMKEHQEQMKQRQVRINICLEG